MLVKEWMVCEPIVIDENTSIMKATQLMKEHNIRRIPVVRDGRLVGIISDRDIKDAAPSKATSLDVHEMYYLLSEIKIKDIMTPDPLSIKVDDTVEKAAIIMLENTISGLPVVDNEGHVLGLITQSDVFKVMISITGAYKSPIQIAFEIEDKSGALNHLLATIHELGGRIVSVLTCTDNTPPERREVYIRIKLIPDDELEELIDKLKKEFKILYTIKEDLHSIPRKKKLSQAA